MKIILGKGQFMGPISGADETLVAYATQLQSAGHSVSVLLMYPHTSEDQYYVRLIEAGVPVSSIAHASAHTSLRAGRKLARLLLHMFPGSREILQRKAQRVATGVASHYFHQCYDSLKAAQPDLIHVITPDPSAMVMIRAAHIAGIPVLYQELGTPYHPPHFESYYEQFTSILPLCAEIAALSPQLAQQCRERLPSANSFSVLPLMTEYSSGSVAAENEQIERHAQVTFGFAARLEPLKGPLILMEAFAAASRKCSNLRATIVGSGSQKQAVMARARTLGVWDQCDFPSVYKTPEHKSAFMQSIDVFVLPSLTEGTPNSIIEAMAHGLPVIATCVGGVPDVVTNDTGVLVPPGDGDALAAAMTRLAKDPSLRSAMGHAAKERYEKLFSSVAVLPLMLSIYQRVAAGSGNYFGVASNSNGFPHPWARNHLMTSKTATQKQAAGSGAVG